MKPKIIVIVGPTGSGKTSLSLELAERYNGEVINADSRQVYKGLDIGTEKISEEDMRGVPHHLLSVVAPQTVYNAQQFAHDAAEVINELTKNHTLPILVGGTFFYIDLLLKKAQSAAVPPNPELRAQLEAYDEEELYAMLQEKDAARAANIDRNNKRRLLRALEILHVLPAVPKIEKHESPYDALIIGLQIDKSELRRGLRSRAERALERGLIEETQKLLHEGVTQERLSEIGLEYRLVLAHLDGELDTNALLQKLEEKNWQYAKRQLVWLKRDRDIVWVQPENREDIHQKVTSFISN